MLSAAILIGTLRVKIWQSYEYCDLENEVTVTKHSLFTSKYHRFTETHFNARIDSH